MHQCKLSLDGSVVMMMMVLFVVLHPLHPVCQSLQLLSEAGQLPFFVPLSPFSVSPQLSFTVMVLSGSTLISSLSRSSTLKIEIDQ